MNGLFVVFHGFSEHSGISKKIAQQRDALIHNGIEMHLCYVDRAEDGSQRRMIDGQEIENYGCGLRAKINKRFSFHCVTRYIQEHGTHFVYIRYDHNANPALLSWFRQLKMVGVKIILEIPTYPYDLEYEGQSLSMRLRLQLDRCFRRCVADYVDRIVTFSDHATIFGRPTIRISNGIDFAQIKLKEHQNDTSKTLRLIGVANIHRWHGFDRVLMGLAEYYRETRDTAVKFQIIGDGGEEEMTEFRRLIDDHNLGSSVSLLGPLSGEALDAQFEQGDFGIGSLGRHRNGITKIKTLKNREYAARGIPFAYSETDDDFDGMPYVLKIPADETPVDIEQLIAFYHHQPYTAADIRNSIRHLSWDQQMKTVVNELAKIE
ncbi:MAG: glycosyltransferase family 1 protein [Alistipes sp.]